ncbi:MAG TPA: ribose 5-phosphate isomerase A [Planctomycetota bacterium]|nr:ribose 5-phosphate isomerase A [Planctomycetota bacterium]
MNPKEIAGRRAAELVRDGMTLGLGTGSTVWFTLQRLAERIAAEGLAVRGVPTSLDTERKARELGIPLATLEEVAQIDLTIDGADEVDGAFRLVKGGGGALLREKVVASISRREAIVVGPDKLVERLADSFPLPIEVVPFARPVVERALRALGFEPRLRRARDGGDYRTDNGNEVLDARFPGGLPDPEAMQARLAAIPGVVESGLFIGLCQTLVIGHPDGRAEVRELGG